MVLDLDFKTIDASQRALNEEKTDSKDVSLGVSDAAWLFSGYSNFGFCSTLFLSSWREILKTNLQRA